MRKYHQGHYKLKNPNKYIGNIDSIVYRSSWELAVLIRLDTHPDILKFGSEENIMPYKSPIDGRMHRYFVDFYVKYKNRNGEEKVALLEVKPFAQTIEPKRTKNAKTYENAVATYVVNCAKWDAAREHCAKKNWSFILITEQNLGLFR